MVGLDGLDKIDVIQQIAEKELERKKTDKQEWGLSIGYKDYNIISIVYRGQNMSMNKEKVP